MSYFALCFSNKGRVLGARVGNIVRKTKGKWLETKLVKAFTNRLRLTFIILLVNHKKNLLSFLVPKDIHVMLKLVERAEYDTYKVSG